jgi:hypothetical protein
MHIPLPVRDNFRNLMDSILQAQLYCDTLALEKWSESTGDDPESYIRYWLDDIYQCIEGRRYNRKLLRWARIERWALQGWCERHGVPLPEFWFPPGWGLEYEWPEEPAPADTPTDAAAPVANERPDDQVTNPAASPASVPDPPSSTPHDVEITGKRVLDRRQRGRIACQEVARRYWIKQPTALIKTVASTHEVQEIAPGCEFELEVVERWLSEVDPRDPSKKRGRKKIIRRSTRPRAQSYLFSS